MKEFRIIEANSVQNEIVQTAFNETCRSYANIVIGKNTPSIIKGMNIYMGIGLMSGSNRVSKGLGLGVVNMACLAREIQKGIMEKGFQSQIIVLIADAHSLNQTTDDVKRKELNLISEQALWTSWKLFQFLGSSEKNIKVLKASDAEWGEISSTDYKEMEIEDIIKSHHKFDCGIKIGWQSKRKKLNGETPKDETFFDNHAINSYPNELNNMAFLYAPEWISLSANLSGNLPLPPYFGDNDQFVLGGPINFNQLTAQNIFTKQMKKALRTMEAMIKLTLSNNERVGSFTFLQDLADFCRL